ncbi:MAG: hypothetical protein ACRD4S_04925 [Candidatus Acidiferrales bacterium]
MDFTIDRPNSYRVEVSGWDQAQEFFVEKTMLDWREQDIKEISLRCTLREGSVVFVQLVQSLAKEVGFPVAYQAVNIGPRNDNGEMRARIEQLRPRTSYKDAVVLSSLPLEIA